MKRLTTEEFIQKARDVHGDKYDYSKVVYVNMHTPVDIICPVHGDILQQPRDHIQGGCKKCGMSKNSGLVLGLGINDTSVNVNKGGKLIPSYQCWREMIRRCSYHLYDNSSCCNEWLYYSNFLNWFDNSSNGRKDGYALDKNILVKGNKVYSPETCCFVPQEINNLIQNNKGCRRELPIGVERLKSGKYKVRYNKGFKTSGLGHFNTIEDAFAAYKQAREAHIKEVAQKYYDDGKITKRVYDALMKYEVEMTD